VGAAIGVGVIGSGFAAVLSHLLGAGAGGGAAPAYDAGARAGYWAAAFIAVVAAGRAWYALRTRSVPAAVAEATVADS
jgi:hypothetical protein